MSFSDFVEELRNDLGYRLRQQVDHIFNVIHGRFMAAHEQLLGMLGPTTSVDEMALYFKEERAVFTFISLAVQRGWVLFNHAEDEVQVSPIPTSYTVRYWFLQHPDYTYRLELMMVDSGLSPYHRAVEESVFSKPGRHCAVVHASFKVANESEFANAVRVFRDAGYGMLQHCESNYGKFSYFDSPEVDTTPLKPRINTRDGDNGVR